MTNGHGPALAHTSPRAPSRWDAHASDPGADYVRDALPRLEEALAASLEESGEVLGGLADTMANAVGTRGRGGRRWRPLLTMAAAEAVGLDADDVLCVAVAVELTHTASLVLDDLPCMDDGAERRGRPSAHLLVGTAGAILLSIGLLAKASEVLAQAPRDVEGLVGEWGRTFGLAGMAGGQAVDLSARGPLHGALRRLHREKSTALAAFAVSAGARAAGASEETRAGLHRFGRDLGWAYQLADDAADRAEDRELGRPLGGRNPRRQSERLLLRALRALDETPGLVPGGADLLSSLAELVVPGEGGPPEGRTAC